MPGATGPPGPPGAFTGIGAFGPTGPTGAGVPGATGATGPAGGFGACVEVNNSAVSGQVTALCPTGYTGTAGGVQCQKGGYASSWGVPSMSSAVDSKGHHLVNGWIGACGSNYPTIVIAVCCPPCPTCTQGYGSYGSYGSNYGSAYGTTTSSNPPPPPPP